MPSNNSTGEAAALDARNASRRVLFRLLIAPTLLLGRFQAWLAEGYRNGTLLERVSIFPLWSVSRLSFLVLLTACQACA